MGAIVMHKGMPMADIADSFIGSGEAFCLLDAYIFALFQYFKEILLSLDLLYFYKVRIIDINFILKGTHFIF